MSYLAKVEASIALERGDRIKLVMEQLKKNYPELSEKTIKDICDKIHKDISREKVAAKSKGWWEGVKSKPGGSAPTKPKLWSAKKSAAKKKFGGKWSRAASLWAVREYKQAGGGWKKAKK